MSQTTPASISPAVSNEEILLATQWNWQAARTLRSLLAAPHDDTPEALAARDQAAIARVAAMMPVNAEEMDIAIHCVAAHERAAEVLLEIRRHDGSAEQRARLSTQYFNAERAADAKRGMLLRVQAARYRREANPKHCYTDEMTMHIATRDLQREIEAAPPAAASGTVLPEPVAQPVPDESPAPPPPGLHLVRSAEAACGAPADALDDDALEDEEFDDAELDPMHSADRALLLAAERRARSMQDAAYEEGSRATPLRRRTG